MSADYAVAIAAIPFFNLLAQEEIMLCEALAKDGSTHDDVHNAANAVDDARKRLIQGIDNAVRTLPEALRNERSLAKTFAYGLVGLADERMLHHPTGILDRWKEGLLETELYDTAIAGQEIVKRARSAALDGNNAESTRKDTEGSSLFAPFYLALLTEGFEGSLRGDTTGLGTLRRTLEDAASSARSPIDTTLTLPLIEHRPSRSAVPASAVAAAMAALWLIGGAILWNAMNADALSESAHIAQRLRAGLPAQSDVGHDRFSIGPGVPATRPADPQ